MKRMSNRLSDQPSETSHRLYQEIKTELEDVGIR